MSSNHNWTLTLLRCHCWQRFRLPFYFWMDEVVSPFTAGQHYMAAGIAQIDAGLTGFPLTSQSQAQITAVTALLQEEISNKGLTQPAQG